ncbi:MAG: LysE family translocator [Pseudonocardiaceae bacterium]
MGNTLAFLLGSVFFIMIPGPSVLFIIGRALAHGRRIAVASAVGNAAGVLLLIVTVAFGLGQLAERSARPRPAVRSARVRPRQPVGRRRWYRPQLDGQVTTAVVHVPRYRWCDDDRHGPRPRVQRPAGLRTAFRTCEGAHSGTSPGSWCYVE